MAALGIIVSQLVELTGRSARLVAERDDAAAIAFPPDFAAMRLDAGRVAEGERRLFAARRTTTESQKAQLRQRVRQLGQEIEGIGSARRAGIEARARGAGACATCTRLRRRAC
jgi:HlyD family secretion protein